MGYLGIVIIVFAVLWCVFFLMLFHYQVFAVMGMFTRKGYPPAKKLGRFGVVISARNEEPVIGALLDSIQNSDYPQENLRVFVVAHNCTDRTAAIARAHGATVYEYNNPKERTLGFAYRYLFRQLRRNRLDAGLDGFLILNADNVLTPSYIRRMNDAFQANGCREVITSCRNSGNFGSNYLSCLYGIFFLAACRYEARGRTLCGCSTRISGTGYLFPAELVTEGWEYVTLTEDWEFSADQIARGRKILYCDEAELFDEQPTTIPIMLRQRLRWACGHMTVFFTRFRALVKSLFSPGHTASQRFSVFDFTASILPLGVMGVGLLLIQILCIALSPLFGYDAGRVWAAYGWLSLAFFLVSYVLTAVFAALLVILERRRIGPLGPGTLTAAILLWPFFMSLNIYLDVAALFLPNLEWKAIPHVGSQRGAPPKTDLEGNL